MISFDLEIKDAAGTRIVPAVFYTTPEEITLGQWCEFHKVLEGLPDWFKELNRMDKITSEATVAEWGAGRWSEYLYNVAEIITPFANLSLREVFHIKTGMAQDLENTPYTDEDFQNSILVIFHEIMNGLGSYEPTIRKEFEWKGATYVLPEDYTDNFGLKTPGPGLSLIESVQALNSEHLLTARDEEGNLVLENAKELTDLSILASLARKRVGENRLEMMPASLMESERWLQRRIKHFEDIPMSIAEDCYFFLLNSKQRSSNTRLSSSLSLLKLTLYLRRSA